MDIIQFIAQFFYRIRYWLLWGGFIVTALVAYFTQFLPFSYTVNSNIYAGVTNVTNIDGSKIENISSTFDNLINIAKSKSTLEKVSLRLLATNLVYGEEWQGDIYNQGQDNLMVRSGRVICTSRQSTTANSCSIHPKKCWLW